MYPNFRMATNIFCSYSDLFVDSDEFVVSDCFIILALYLLYFLP